MSQVSNSQTLTANGTTTAVSAVGPVVLVLTGDFGSGTAQFQMRPPGASEYVDLPDGSFTAAAAKVFNFPAATKNDYRVSLSGATSPDLDIVVQAD